MHGRLATVFVNIDPAREHYFKNAGSFPATFPVQYFRHREQRKANLTQTEHKTSWSFFAKLPT